MVSFGEPCSFSCKYCYTRSGSFENYQQRSASEIIEALRHFPKDSYDYIYVSCDMEPFVDQARALDLLSVLSELDKTIHFTTKAKLSSKTIAELGNINNRMKRLGTLLIPAVTITSWESSPLLEPNPIPGPEERLATIRALWQSGLDVVLALRPFLPFVTLDEYRKIIDFSAEYIACVLGGVLYFDQDGVMEKDLGHQIPDYITAPMNFVDRPGRWKVYLGEDKRFFLESYCNSLGIPFFMTSTPAMKFLSTRKRG